jgi:hypothetical protein
MLLESKKLLLRIHEPEKQLMLVTAYKSAAKHLYPNQEEIEKAERYADFTNILLKLFEKLGNQAADLRHIVAFLSSLELLELMDEAITEFVTHTSDSHWGELKRETESKTLSTSELTDLSEWVTHRRHGALNDIGFAGARVLNWLIQFTNLSKRVTNKQSRSEKQEKLYSTVRESLHVLLHIASNWNSLEYAADKVSYGEWFITNIRNTDPLEIEFSFSDISLAHANEIGLRREIIGLYRGKKEPRWMQEYLEGFALSATTAAIRFYVSSSRPPSFSQKIFTDLKPRILELLGFLDAEDELLLAAAKDDLSVLAQYLATIALFCFTVTSRFVKQQSGKNIRG